MGVEKKRCVTCDEEISAKAKKCINCGSFQNYRRHLDLGNTSLALVIALVSVLGMAVGNISHLKTIYYDSIDLPATVRLVHLDLDKAQFSYQAYSGDIYINDYSVECRVPGDSKDFKLMGSVRSPKTDDEKTMFYALYYRSEAVSFLDPINPVLLTYELNMEHQSRTRGSYAKNNDVYPNGYCVFWLQTIEEGKEFRDNFLPIMVKIDSVTRKSMLRSLRQYYEMPDISKATSTSANSNLIVPATH